MQPRQRKRFNPFYLLVLIAGTAFALTACAYGVMTVKELRRGQMIEASTPEDRRFTEFLDRHGPQLMFAELAALAIFTFVSIGLDQYFTSADFAGRPASEETEQWRAGPPNTESESTPTP